MVFELSTSVLVAGAFQGLLLGGFIFLQGRNQVALRFLAVAILLASVNTFLFSLEDLHRLLGCPLCNLLTRLTFFLFGPLVYLFIYHKIQSRKPQINHLIHLIPFVCLGFLSFLAYQNEELAQNELVRMFLPIHFNTTYFYEVLRIFHVLLYGFLSYRLIKSSGASNKDVGWLKNFVIIAAATYCLVAVTLKLNYYSGKPEINEFHALFMVIPLFIYFTTYKVLELQNFRISAIRSQTYKNTKLKDVNIIAQNLGELMQSHKIYLNSDISLSLVAAKLDISRHKLSQFLNGEMNVKFNDYINQLRVKEAQSLIEKTSNQLTLEAIGLNVGFKSKTTFISAFKKHSNMTPGEYRKFILSA